MLQRAASNSREISREDFYNIMTKKSIWWVHILQLFNIMQVFPNIEGTVYGRGHILVMAELFSKELVNKLLNGLDWFIILLILVSMIKLNNHLNYRQETYGIFQKSNVICLLIRFRRATNLSCEP